MAKITQYQQGRLASSLVGTPNEGLARSAALSSERTFDEVGSGLKQLGAGQLQQYNMAQAQAQAKVDAQQKLLDDMSRKTEVTNIASGAQVDMQQHMNDLQMKYRNNPQQAFDEFNQMATDKINNTVSQVQDPQTKMMLQEKLATMHASAMNSLGDWQRSRQVPIAEQNLKDSAGSLSLATGQMAAQDPQAVKNTIDKYAHDTHDQYQFFHQKGLVGQFEASSDAVKQYLEATAADGDPDLLEKRIKEFSDGKYIKPSELQSVAVQQRGIAAQVRMAQNTEQTKLNNATYLDTVQSLLSAGNGDMRAVNPAVAQQILNKAAPNLTTAHNVQLQEMISRNAVEQKEREAKIQAETMALGASPTGELSKTPVAALKQAAATPGLSPEEQTRYESQIARTVAATKSLAVDQQIATNIGASAAGVDKLATIIHGQLASMMTIHDPAIRGKALQQLQQNIDRYQEAYISLHSLKNTIKDPGLKAITDLHANTAEKEFGHLVGALKNEPNAMAEHQAITNLYQAVTPQQIFSDPRQQQSYNYFHKKIFFDTIGKYNFSPKDMTMILSNPKNLQALKNTIQKNTMIWMHNYNVTP